MTDEPVDRSDAPGDEPEPPRPDPRTDPVAAIFGGNVDPNNLGAAFERIGRLLSWQGGPVNWDLARDVARQTITELGDRSVGDADRRAVADAVRLADHWLDTATSLPAASATSTAWSRAEWFEATVPVWQRLVDPVATHVVDAMSSAMPEEAKEISGPMLGMMRQVGGAMFGAQVGQALGSLAGEVVGSTDIGLPLADSSQVALLPANVAAFGAGLGVAIDDVRLYLALREAAYGRLFAHVPWLRPRLLESVEEYGKGITIDMSRMEEAVRDLDPSRPEALQEVFSSGLFQPEVTPTQQISLNRIETLLALVEGWVDDVVTDATADRLPTAVALREAVRRRRAAGGPAEQTFATRVGLELRPRRLRDAATLWAAVRAERGAPGRDAVWSHPDLVPSSDDLDDPMGFVARGNGLDDLDLSSLTDPAPAEDAPDGASSESPADEPDTGPEPTEPTEPTEPSA